MSGIKVSLVRIAAHELNRALRVWRRTLPPIAILESILRERERAMSRMIGSFAATMVLTLWLLANRPNLELVISLIELQIPKAYVNLALSSFAVGALLQMMNYLVLNELVRLAVDKLFRFDNAPALTSIKDGNSSWSLGMLPQYRFLQSSWIHILIGITSIVFLMLPIVLALVAVYVTIFSVGFEAIRADGLVSVNGLVSVISCLFATFPLAYGVVIFVPFSFEKNRRFVRWVFLSSLYRPIGFPPRATHWIDQSDASGSESR